MEIIKENTTQLKNLDVGECFLYRNKIHLKVENDITYVRYDEESSRSFKFNCLAVNLESDVIEQIEENEWIYVVNAKLVMTP